MPASKPSSSGGDDTKALDDLRATVTSTHSILQYFLSVLKSPTPSTPPTHNDAPHPLAVLHTSATLLKAHTTRLSLLIINKPFTPSAIRQVITDIASTVVPALMSGVGLCTPQRYNQLIHDEARAVVRTILRELEQMLDRLRRYLDDEQIERSRDSLVSTGVLWGACDELIKLQTEGLPALVLRKARILRDTIEDEIEELREWAAASDETDGDEEDNDEEEDDEDDADVHSNGDADSIERMFSAPSKLPKDRPDLKSTLDDSLTTLRLLRSMYDAVIKHRFETLSDVKQDTLFDAVQTGDGIASVGTDTTRSLAHKVDDLLAPLRQLPDDVAELAGSLYELDNDDSRKRLDEIRELAENVAVAAGASWWPPDQGKFSRFASIWARLRQGSSDAA